MILSDRLKQFQAVSRRHVVVAHDTVDWLLTQAFERVLWRGLDEHLHRLVLSLEEQAAEFDEILIVVDEQHSDVVGSGVGRRPTTGAREKRIVDASHTLSQLWVLLLLVIMWWKVSLTDTYWTAVVMGAQFLRFVPTSDAAWLWMTTAIVPANRTTPTATAALSTGSRTAGSPEGVGDETGTPSEEASEVESRQSGIVELVNYRHWFAAQHAPVAVHPDEERADVGRATPRR